jgi:hypothetical protein
MKTIEERHRTAKCDRCNRIGHIKRNCTIYDYIVGKSIKMYYSIYDSVRYYLTNQKIKNLYSIYALHSLYGISDIYFDNGKKIEVISHSKGKIYYEDIENYWTKRIFENGTPIKVSASLSWLGIANMLSQIGLVTYDVIPEDKRSPPNLLKFTSIDGGSVNHNPKCENNRKDNIHYKRVSNLFDTYILGPYGCREAIITCTLIFNVNRFNCNMPKEIFKIIMTMLWDTRHDSEWKHANDIDYLRKNKKTLKIILC